MPAYLRVGIVLLAGLAGLQSALIGFAAWRARHPAEVQLVPGRLADAELLSRPPSRRSLIETFGSKESLGELVQGNRCSVVVFFSSSCPALREFSRSWGGLSEIVSSSWSTPVVWVAIFPSDSLAADSARAAASVQRVFWLTRADDAQVRGVHLIPSAWILDSSLRVYGVTTDTGQARAALMECLEPIANPPVASPPTTSEIPPIVAVPTMETWPRG